MLLSILGHRSVKRILIGSLYFSTFSPYSFVTLVCISILSLFFGDFMDRKANPRLYDEIQDTEGLSAVRYDICFTFL